MEVPEALTVTGILAPYVKRLALYLPLQTFHSCLGGITLALGSIVADAAALGRIYLFVSHVSQHKKRARVSSSGENRTTVPQLGPRITHPADNFVQSVSE